MKIKNFIILMYVLISASMFISCGDDEKDEPESFDPSVLAGEWIESRADGSDIEIFHYEFKSDGTGCHWATDNGVIDSYGKTAIEWSATPTILTIKYPSETAKWSYTLSGDNLTMTWEGDTQRYKRSK